MTRAILLGLLLCALPAAAWDYLAGTEVDARAAEIDKRWRPYSKTMVDLDILKHALQDQRPDWVKEEMRKTAPPERPFGRMAGFTLREKTVRYLFVGRHGPFTPTAADRTGKLAALKAAEGAAASALLEALAKDGSRGWELSSSAPGRPVLHSDGADGGDRVKVVWHYLDFYREDGADPQLYLFIMADAPRSGVPQEPAAPDATGGRRWRPR